MAKSKRNKGGIVPKIQCLQAWATEKGLPKTKTSITDVMYNPNFKQKHGNNL